MNQRLPLGPHQTSRWGSPPTRATAAGAADNARSLVDHQAAGCAAQATTEATKAHLPFGRVALLAGLAVAPRAHQRDTSAGVHGLADRALTGRVEAARLAGRADGRNAMTTT